MLATSQQSGSSAKGARFGRRWVSRSSPVSGSVVTETTVWLIGPKLADEGRVGDAQPDLGLRPWAVCGLRAQHLAHRVADRQQGADDLGGLGGNPLAAPALLDGDRSTRRR